MGKKAQRRRAKLHRIEGTEEGQDARYVAATRRRSRIPRWSVPAATIVLSGGAWFALESSTVAGTIALLGILASIGVLMFHLEDEIPAADRDRAASIDFGRKG